MTAHAIAGAPSPEGRAPAAAEPLTYVAFELDGQLFAVDVANVREILDLQPIARLPNAPGEVLGMIDVRGEGIAVVDLPGRLGFMGGRGADDGRILVFELGGARTPVGVIADRVLGVVEIGAEGVEPAPAGASGWRAEALTGVARIGGRLTMLLALDRLFGAAAPGEFDFA